MNDHDRDNLKFLLSLKTTKDWERWANHCELDDFLYAMELIKTAMAEETVKSMELNEKYEEEEMDLSEARAVLSKFQL